MKYKNPEVQPIGDGQLEIQRKLTKPNSTADLKRLNNPKINSKSGEEATIH